MKYWKKVISIIFDMPLEISQTDPNLISSHRA